MASPFGSQTKKADTDPGIDGAVYEFEHKDQDGKVVALERGTIHGTWTDLESGVVQGNLYHYKRGGNIFRVTEGTESFSQWKLISAPSKTAATHARNVYKAKIAEAAAKVEEERAANKRRRKAS